MNLKTVSRPLRLLTLLSSVVFLVGCFGEGDGPAQIKATAVPPTTGIFVDSNISGAGWETSSGASGLTNADGEFMYVPGENVTFSVGGIVLGTARGAPIITAVELTGSNNPTDQAAINQFVFLQSIDDDQDPTNGITISSSTQAAAASQTLNFADPNFATAVVPVVAAIAPGNLIVSNIAALAHFYTTFANLGGTDAFSFSFPGFPPTRSGVTYELAFADEFDEGTAPDPEIWNYELGYGDNGWGNNEWQLYTDSQDNVRVEDGNLVIQARCDTPPCGVRDGTVTSGRINTKDKFEFRYGTVVARIKPPVGKGAWPAFWSLGAVFPDTPWPRAGEIDFMEMHNFFSNKATTHFTMHWCDETIQFPDECSFPAGRIFDSQSLDFSNPGSGNFVSADYSLGDDYHLFEADWDQDRMIGRIDGIPYFEREIEADTMEEFLREFFMILNVAMGGTLGSGEQPPSGDEVWPQTMLVDYVRVFQRTDAPSQELFIDFEGSPADFNFANFEGGVGDVIMNPVAEGINTSAGVGRIRKFAAESLQTFGGSTLVGAFDVPPSSSFTAKVWSSRPVNVLFKVEGVTGAEAEVGHGGTGWEELTFNLSAFSGNATGITFIFDNGVLGAADTNPAAWTFYVDDIRRSLVQAQINLPINFDDSAVDYTLTDFGDPVTAMTTLVDDPDDAGNTVASTTKPLMAPIWAGTTMSTSAGLATAIPFTASTATIGVRVYSPAAGIPVRLKADDVVNGSVSVETERMTTVANQWETLVFDFSNEVDGTAALDLDTSYTALSIFFNFGTEGSGATYLWDDVEFGVALPDTTAPTLTSVGIESDNANTALAVAGDVVTVTLTADESIVAPTVTIGGAAADTVDGGGASWVASRTLTGADADGVITFAIQFADLVGNAGTPVSAATDGSSVTVDATLPTVAILGAPSTFTTLDPIMLTFQFSEPVTGFTLSDIMRAGGSASAFATVDGDTYTANVTPNGSGDLTVAVAAGVAIDAAGNANETAAGVTIVNDLDADAPLMTVVGLTSSNANPAFAITDDVVTINMTANEDILEPTVTIAGAAADAVTGAGTSWQASRTMLATDAEGEIAFTINFQDLGGNAGPQTTATTDESSVIFDITLPTLSIDGVPATVQTIDPIAVTFQFDEDVSNFAIGDIAVTNGSPGSFASVDAATYTANVTPDGAGDLTISVAVDAATDLAGNGNAAASAMATVDLTPFWQQVWSDEFTGVTLNTGNWTKRTDADCPDPCSGVQSFRAERVSVGAGQLTIESRDDIARGGPNYTSGLIDTRGKLELQHGRIEIDVKLPAGTAGVKPALLLLPATDEYGPWPLSGEIDVTNAPNGGGLPLEHTLVFGLPEPENTIATATSTAPVNASTQLFTYALEWEAGELRWFVDGTHVATQIQDNWYTYAQDADGVYTLEAGAAPFDQDFYLVLSQAVEVAGGTYPQRLQVDSVRVFQCTNAVDPAAGTGCVGLIDAVDPAIEPVVATSPPYNGAPFIEALQVYTNAPAALDFEDEGGMTTAGTLVPVTFNDPGVTVASNVSAPDGGNTVWNLNIDANSGTGGVFMGPADFGAATGSFDLTGGATAGEVLFRMRVNSAVSDPQLTAGLDSSAGTGDQVLTFVADSTWRNYSVKVSDLVSNSVMQGASLDLAGLVNLFRLEASGGTVNLDVDDIQIKVACRDNGRCEATPRISSVPPEVEYMQDFEAMIPNEMAQPNSFSDDDWVVFGSVFDASGNFIYGYGTFPAPNGGGGFSAIVDDQGGTEQGSRQLSIYNDYDNADHGNNRRIEASVFRERTIVADDVGRTLTFSFDAKLGNIELTSTANGFIKTLDPGAGFSTTNLVTVDTTNISGDWLRYEMSLEIDAGLVGQLLQFGFATTATNFEGSGIFYDNLLLEKTAQ